MPAIQTSYVETMVPGQAGLVANMEIANSITRIIEDADGVGFGRALFDGAADLGCTKTPGTRFLGVSIADRSIVPPGTTVPADTYPQRANVGIHEKGVIWVVAGATITRGQAAYVTAAGVWTSTTTGNTAIPNATFDSSAASGAVVKLRLR